MNNAALEAYLLQRLAELDKKKDLMDMVDKGRLSFRMDATHYRHLPGWDGLVLQKKKLVRSVWIDSLFFSVVISLLTTNITEKFMENW